MATPGRTHIPWQTQEGQIAELISYISFLEAKLSYLQFHHEHCDLLGESLALDSNLPYLPPDIVVANDEAAKAGTHLQLPLTPPAPATPHTPEASVSPPAQSARVKTLPKKGSSPRWKRIVDQMLAGWEQPGSWADKRTSIGLHSVEQNQHVLTLILGLKNETPHADTEIDYFNTGAIKQSEQSASDFLINSARKYALDTKSSATDPDHVAQIHLFREFVFASLCVVMEQQGLPIDTINDLMRICMSSSGPANLYRLRRGALWVNRVIAGTLVKKLGWNYNATEFFLLCGYCVLGCKLTDVG